MRARPMLILSALLLAALPLGAAEVPGGWTEVARSGMALGGATVYSPARKQVLRWGGLRGANQVQALDHAAGKWVADYESDKCEVGGNFYGGQTWAGWLKTVNRPGGFFIFRQACWDSKRNRMIIAAHNLTAAYDPVKKEWTDLKAGYAGKDGVRKEGCPPPGWEQPWFAPVPGQWGSCAYDAVNDEVVIFPLWLTRAYEWNSKGGHRPGPEQPEDAGVRAGHYGTFTFDMQTNTWRNPELGGKEMLGYRAALAEAIMAQREATRAGWNALLALRREHKTEAAKLMAPAGEAQQTVLARLATLRAELEKGASTLTGYESVQAQDGAKQLAATILKLEQTRAEFSAAKPETLPALHAQQEAGYRELRVIRDEELYVQPLPRCSTSVVYDAKNQVMVMAGGTHLDRALNDTWVYHCKTRRWQRRAPAPEGMEWPGVCYDGKRGLVLYAAGKGTYAYDAAKDQWFRAGPGIPKYQAWSFYCDMAYDEAADRYVLNIARDKHGADETTFVLVPAAPGEAVATRLVAREKTGRDPFPPPATEAALARLKSMPANTWIAAKPLFEPTHRSWSTMSWDAGLRCVIYQGGGHAGTMDNTISAYFPESNQWVNAFPTQGTPSIFGSWSCAGGFPSFERGMGLSQHCRYYESHNGEIVAGSSAGFQWASRERPLDFQQRKVPPGNFCLDETRERIVSRHGDKVHVYDLKTRETVVHAPQGPAPQIGWEWSGMDVHPDKNWLVLHGAGQRDKKTDNETWVFDLANPGAWRKLDLKRGTPQVSMSKLNAIPGTSLIVCAMPESTDLWVLDLDKQTWQPLPAADGDDKLNGKKRFDIYGQCVYDPHHKLFVMVGLRGGSYENRHTFLLKPDFSAIDWNK